MPTTLPVPIEFSLPEGWRAAPPDEVGASEVAFIALYPQPDEGFTANITLDGGFLREETTMEELADASVQQVLGAAESVVVATRHDVGSAAAPGLTQRLDVTVVVAGVRRELVQSQVYMALTDATDPHKRALVRSILTATAAQHDDVLPDFQEFLRTVRPDPGPNAGTGA
ncbi:MULTISPECIES: hypothetical protein [unclassified Streptomyces]|uniref:hypothetical protein n=1 Tax=unclassified Streptomyces TaxID=2593676 RepID=UPI002E35D25A|nr:MULTISPECIES: hypothetical protein [unclassified Streptomyces]WUC66883.1 hypothetical protein OG861_23135 [Streptomyces sp. NBC_00539]